MDFSCILEAKLDDLGANNAIKNPSKNNAIFDAFFDGFWRANCKKNFREFCPGDSPLGAWNSEFAY